MTTILKDKNREENDSILEITQLQFAKKLIIYSIKAMAGPVDGRCKLNKRRQIRESFPLKLNDFATLPAAWTRAGCTARPHQVDDSVLAGDNTSC
jgi:hypothetical protein